MTFRTTLPYPKLPRLLGPLSSVPCQSKSQRQIHKKGGWEFPCRERFEPARVDHPRSCERGRAVVASAQAMNRSVLCHSKNIMATNKRTLAPVDLAILSQKSWSPTCRPALSHETLPSWFFGRMVSQMLRLLGLSPSSQETKSDGIDDPLTRTPNAIQPN